MPELGRLYTAARYLDNSGQRGFELFKRPSYDGRTTLFMLDAITTIAGCLLLGPRQFEACSLAMLTQDCKVPLGLTYSFLEGLAHPDGGAGTLLP